MPGGPSPFGPGYAPTLGGSAPSLLPQASTLQPSQVAATGAYLNGSVNPLGLAGTWWFVWGASPAYGNTTATTSAGSGSLPLTVGAAITGLTTGRTYHFAVAVSTANGTVYGADVSFVAQTASPVTNPAEVGVSLAAGLNIPHLKFPFRLTNAGAVVEEQDSLAEVYSSVRSIGVCPAGVVPELPGGFGVPDLTFGPLPLDPSALTVALARWEPRATEDAVVQALGDENLGAVQIQVMTSTKTASGEI